MNSPYNIYSQCQPSVFEEIFPGWQWRFVNPITKQEEEEYQPFNTSLPACSKYASLLLKSESVYCYMLFISLIVMKQDAVFKGSKLYDIDFNALIAL